MPRFSTPRKRTYSEFGGSYTVIHFVSLLYSSWLTFNKCFYLIHQGFLKRLQSWIEQLTRFPSQSPLGSEIRPQYRSSGSAFWQSSVQIQNKKQFSYEIKSTAVLKCVWAQVPWRCFSVEKCLLALCIWFFASHFLFEAWKKNISKCCLLIIANVTLR